MNNTIPGSALSDCNTWYDVYTKLSTPPNPIDLKYLEAVKAYAEDLHCTGCLKDYAAAEVVVVDTKNYSNNVRIHGKPIMKTINDWNVEGYQKFCHQCKDNYDRLALVLKGIESLESKNIPECWVQATYLKDQTYKKSLLRSVRAIEDRVFNPPIKCGLINSGNGCYIYGASSYLAFPNMSSYFKNVKTRFKEYKGCDLKQNSTIFDLRAIVTQHFNMWALIDNKWTGHLSSEFKKHGIESCLEVGAGNGWLAKALRQHGMTVIATDEYVAKDDTVIDIEELEAADAIQKYSDTDALIISWPHGNAGEMIKNWPVGKWVVYIGEKPGGANAQKDFFAQIDFASYQEISMPRWQSSNDLCLIGKKTCDFNPEFYDYESYDE